MNNTTLHRGNSRHSLIVPYRMGILLDRDDAAHRDLVDAIRLGIDESRSSGALDRNIDLVVSQVSGRPEGSALDAVGAWQELCEEHTLLGMVGPFDDENGASLRDVIEANELPVLTTSAEDGFCGNNIFQLTADHLIDQAHLLLRHTRALKLAQPVVVREAGARGDALEIGVRRAARQNSFQDLAVIERNPRLQQNLSRARCAGSNAVIYLGGREHGAIDAALTALAWTPPRLTGTEVMRAHSIYGAAPSLEGWIGLDSVDNANKVFQLFVAAFSARYGRLADHARAAQGYDMGRMIGMVCSVIRPPSPDGLRDGFDRIRMLPAATGALGTVISFARYDHRGLKNNPHVFVTVKHGRIVRL